MPCCATSHGLGRRRPGPWLVAQHGIYNPDTTWETLPAVAMDSAGDLAATWQAAVRDDPNSTSTLSTFKYSGRTPADPPGLLRRPRQVVASSFADPSGRLGDFTSVALDPIDGCTLWITGQSTDPGDLFPDTRVTTARFKFPGCPDVT